MCARRALSMGQLRMHYLASVGAGLPHREGIEKSVAVQSWGDLLTLTARMHGLLHPGWPWRLVRRAPPWPTLTLCQLCEVPQAMGLVVCQTCWVGVPRRDTARQRVNEPQCHTEAMGMLLSEGC